MQGRSGSVATDSVCLSAKSDTVATDNKSTTDNFCDSDSDSDCGDESEKDDESLQEAYERMYTQWLKVYTTNRALNSEIQELCDLKMKAKGKMVKLEMLLVKKDEISSLLQ